MAKILLVEDDKELSRQVKDWLCGQHFNVETVFDGNEAMELLNYYSYDLVILDWQLPGKQGIDILKEYRDGGAVCPVLMLTSKDTVSDIEAGLYEGADDYLTKPIELRELSARVNALIRRQSKNYDSVLKVRNLELDIRSHKLFKDGKELALQPQEFSLLEFMMRNSKAVFSIDALLERVWPSQSDASPDTVRVCITRLRNKIDTPGEKSIIKTIHRVGYQIDDGE